MMPPGGRFPPPPLHPPFPAPIIHHPQEEAAAVSISDQRTLYLVNIFIGNTARFLNSFSALCEDKLAHLHRRILKLDATLNVLEAKLRNTCDSPELEDNNGIGAIRSSSQPMLQNLLPHKRIPNRPSGSGSSSSEDFSESKSTPST